MSTKANDNKPQIMALLQTALDGEAAPLESYLMTNSGLPGPRMNLALPGAFADVIGEIVTPPDLNVERLEALLDGWAALSIDEAPDNQPRVILPCTAALAYGQVGVSRPDWWGDEIAKLYRAAADPRWRVREMVAAALQRMLAADWARTHAALFEWLKTDDALIVRAAAAGVAEPPLLTDAQRGIDAIAVQAAAVNWLKAMPQTRRRDEDIRTLRKALGFTVSVAAAAAPEAGFDLLLAMAQSGDEDLRWIVRENLKKNRLQKWPEQVQQVQAALEGRP